MKLNKELLEKDITILDKVNDRVYWDLKELIEKCFEKIEA